MKLKTSEVFDFIKNGEVDKLESYLKNGGEPELKNDFNQTLLLAATFANNYKMAEILLKYNASVNTQDKWWDNPFLIAGKLGFYELMSLYLKHNPRFDLFNWNYETALMLACQNTHNKTVKLLLDTPGYPINHISKFGWTALMGAVVLGKAGQKQIETVRLLVEAGVNANIVDPKSAKPLLRAKNKGYTEIVEILEKVTGN